MKQKYKYFIYYILNELRMYSIDMFFESFVIIILTSSILSCVIFILFAEYLPFLTIQNFIIGLSFYIISYIIFFIYKQVCLILYDGFNLNNHNLSYKNYIVMPFLLFNWAMCPVYKCPYNYSSVKDKMNFLKQNTDYLLIESMFYENSYIVFKNKNDALRAKLILILI